MCGLLAVLNRRRPVDEEAAGRAFQRLAHRGPDGNGSIRGWDDRLLLGHRRLAILDPGRGGAQPMRDPETGSQLIFNGAIYNFLELRQEMEEQGHRFASDSDTEVVLAAWRHWGAAAFSRFNGMWAIILLDGPSDSLVVCRDRLGVKPLYHVDDGTCQVFASEIRAAAIAAGLTVRPDATSVFDYLISGSTEHDGRTFLEGVVEVPPGALWRIGRDGRVTRGRYHDWPETGGPSPSAEEVRALLLDATRLRLRADVPTVALLSGGVDSSIVGWAAAKVREPRSRFEGFLTYGYLDGGIHDETDRAGRIAASVAPGLRHTVLRVDPVPTGPDLMALMAAQEQPFSTPSILAGLRLYRLLAAQGVKVALTGEGADELFGGYTRRYANLMVRDLLRRGRMGEAVRLLRSPHASLGLLGNRLVWDLPESVVRLLLRRYRINVAAMSEPLWEGMRERLLDRLADNRRPLAQILRHDVTQTLLPAVLRFADRNGMAAGIEVRAPFLDHRLVDLAMRLPAGEKLSAAGGKLPLRRAFAGLLPDEVIAAPKERGLGMAEQFQVGRLDLKFLFAKPPVSAEAFLDVARLKAAFVRHPNDPLLWWPVCLLLWLTRLETGDANDS